MAEEKTKKTASEEVKEEKAIPKTEKPKKKKSNESEKIKKELEEQKALLLRTAAEFDNYKKRTEREKSALSEYVKAQTLKPLLQIFDNIDRSSGFEPGSAEYNKGIEMIVKQLTSVRENLGLEEIGETGEAFDPNIHEAVMHVENEDLGENTVAMVMQKGYKIGDTVIRPAMVQVAN